MRSMLLVLIAVVFAYWLGLPKDEHISRNTQEERAHRVVIAKLEAQLGVYANEIKRLDAELTSCRRKHAR